MRPARRQLERRWTMCLQAPSIIPVATSRASARWRSRGSPSCLEVAGAFVGAGVLGAAVAVGGGAAADPGRDLRGFPVQDLAGLVCDPFLGGGLAHAGKGPGGLPAVTGTH